MNIKQDNLASERAEVLRAIRAFEVESAENVTRVCKYLEEFQMSPQAWIICSDILWELNMHPTSVLFICGTMLRQKIRTQLNMLTNEAQGQLRDTLVLQVKYAANLEREGIDSIMRLISLIIADIGMRIYDRPFIVRNMITDLWYHAPQALFEIIQLLPEQPRGNELELQQQQQLLRNQGDTVLQLLTNFLNRMDMDLTSISRGCFICFGAWAHKGLLPLDTMLEHTVLLRAIALLKQPELMPWQLYAEASKCIVGVINCADNHPLASNPDVMQKIRLNIFGIVSDINTSFNQLDRKEKDDCAEIFTKLTEVFAGIEAKDLTTDALINFGPFCFQLQLHVVEQCSMIAVLDSLHVWHQLAWQLLRRYELELYHLYQPLVKRFVLDLYPKCRLTHPSDVNKEVLSSLRSQLQDLVPKFADLIGLNDIIPDELNKIGDTLSPEPDLEMALFFVGQLVECLDFKLPHIVDLLMNGLPKLYPRTLFCLLPAHEQLIFCLSKCHLVKNNLKLRHDFVVHLSYVYTTAINNALITAAMEAFKVLANMYKDVADLKHLFNTRCIDNM